MDAERNRRLKAYGIELNETGQIVPTQAAIELARVEHPGATDADLAFHACALTLALAGVHFGPDGNPLPRN
jgi:hypothetical protein